MSGSKERYPGMRELAEKTFSSTPTELHGLVSRKMKFYLDIAKSQGVATTMDWAQQSLKRLKDKFGPVPESISKVEAASPKVPSGKTPIVEPSRKTAQNTPNTFKAHKVVHNAANTATAPASAPHAMETPTAPHETEAQTTAVATKAAPKIATPSEMAPLFVPKSIRAMAKSAHSEQNRPPASTASEAARSGPKFVSSASVPSASPGPETNGRKKRALSTTPSLSRKKQNTDDPVTARQMRFQSTTASKISTPSPYVDHQLTHTVVGTFQELEKPYFRLTGQVNPAAVRPPNILERSLSHVMAKYDSDRTNYAYISEQLQSIRQDLTVQHIETKLTLRVYETNARVALYHDDIGEFNKCLTRVLQLHEQLPGKIKCKNEFRAYSLYYMLLLKRWSDISLVMKDSNRDGRGVAVNFFNKVTPLPENAKDEYPRAPSKQQEMFNRSLMCAHCVQIKDLHLLEAHSRSAWPLEMNLLKLILERERVAALEAIFTATYQQKQTHSVSTIGSLLGLNEPAKAKHILDEWSVPMSGDTVSSEEALPVIKLKQAQYGKRVDIKGQK